MRLFLTVMLAALGIVLVGFLIANTGERVSVTLGTAQYPEVRLATVVLISLAVGVAFTAVIALVEGTTLRLANRRLRRELNKLETENSFLRTQPPIASRPEPDSLEPVESAAPSVTRTDDRSARFPTAPVYGQDEEDETVDPDEDAYSGGRAV